MTLIKICGFTRPRDVEVALEAGVDAIGVVLADDARVPLSEVQAKEVLSAARGASVQRIAVVGAASLQAARRAFELGFNAIQLVMHEELDPEERPDFPIIPVFFDGPDLIRRIKAYKKSALWPAKSPEVGSVIGCYTIDSARGGGTGTVADWSRASLAALYWPLMLAGGINANNVRECRRRVRPRAIDVSSGVESEPGIKDRNKIFELVQRTHLSLT